jgi:hypothetical protein
LWFHDSEAVTGMLRTFGTLSSDEVAVYLTGTLSSSLFARHVPSLHFDNMMAAIADAIWSINWILGS